jgi:MscS family membrane protein
VFDSFGENSLSISIEYFISLKPNKEFLQEKEEINFQIMEIIERHGGEFFYPVQEIRRADENKNMPQ